MKLNKVLKSILGVSILALVSIAAYNYLYIPNAKLKEVGDCTPNNFKREKESSDYFLTWNTKGECTGYVRYGSSDTSFPYVALDQQGVVKLKEHKVKVSGVDKGSKYYFVIVSDDKNYGNGSLPIPITFE